MKANHKLSIKNENKLDEEKKGKYQWLVEKVIYFTLTKPDITYAINIVS